jgi:rhamnogalacturonan endolyase
MALRLNETALIYYAINIVFWILFSILLLIFGTKSNVKRRNEENRIFGKFGLFFGSVRLIFHIIVLFYPNDLLLTILVYMITSVAFSLLIYRLERLYFERRYIKYGFAIISLDILLLMGISLQLFEFELALIAFNIEIVLILIWLLGFPFRRRKNTNLRRSISNIIIFSGLIVILFGSYASTEIFAYYPEWENYSPLIMLSGLIITYSMLFLRISDFKAVSRRRAARRSKKQVLKNYTLKFGLLLIILLSFQSYLWISNEFRIQVELGYSGGVRYSEYLDRGLIAFYNDSDAESVYVGWRLLDTDPANISFHVYRNNSTDDALLLTPIPINSTNYIDSTPKYDDPENISYYLRPVIESVEGATSKSSKILNIQHPSSSYISIPLEGNYKFQKVAVADLNGDGAYDYIIKHPDVNVDPFSHRPSSGTYKIDAYLSNGTFLWRNDLGWDIEMGIWYSPYVAYDFNMDGKAEIAVKTGEGDHRDRTGHVQSGPEYVSIWDGMTGEEITRAPWPKRTFNPYNWLYRNQIGVAYLDGKNPYLLLERGTYTDLTLHAYNYSNGMLKKMWEWHSSNEGGIFGINSYFGQGAHTIHSADIDEDGCDEVILGSCVIDQNGRGLWSTGLSHCDQCYVGELDPTHPGLEISYGIEGELGIGIIPHPKNGICVVEAATGKILWGIDETTVHIHRQGLVADIDKSFPGMEIYCGEADYPKRWLHSANGTLIATEASFNIGLNPKAVYWDSDFQRELLHQNRIFNFGAQNDPYCLIEGEVVATADIFGDWREEIITSRDGKLRIYSTVTPAFNRSITLMRDPIYRSDVAHISMGYSQVPTTSYCLSF